MLAQIVGAAHAQELWGPLMRFATELEDRTQVLIAKLLAVVALRESAEEHHLQKLSQALAKA